MRRIFGITLTFLTVFAAAATDAVTTVDEDFRVWSVRVEVSEREFSGECPHRFEFTGYITVNQPGTVRYRWLRSDRARAPVETLVFTRPGTRMVRTDWRLGSGTQSYRNFWRAIEILAPNRLVSDRALFTLNCRMITRVALPVYEISGTIDTGTPSLRDPYRQVRVIVADGRTPVANQVVTLNDRGYAEYRFQLRNRGRYVITVESVPYKEEEEVYICYKGVRPANRRVNLTSDNRIARNQNFTILWTLGLRPGGPCW